MHQEQTRSQEILLPATISQSEITALTNVISDADFILNFKINDRTLCVEYTFPALSFGNIWELISDIIPATRFSFLFKWKYKLFAMLETNEQDHLLEHYGWDKFITDIYVTHQHIASQDSNKHKLWQNNNQSLDKK
ncbi:MAG: hypothetical protein ACI9XC_000599 [Gammaproteobacteria bacterium]|jgi:hypothetical protein